MNTVDSLPETPNRRRTARGGGIAKGLATAVVGVLAILSAPSLTAFVTQRVDDIHAQRRLASEARQKQIALSLIGREKDHFLQEQVHPLLQATLTKNHEALARARETLASSLDRYKSGIEPFIRDLRSWSTEFGVVTKSISGWWWGDGRFDRFMEEKFAAHLFTDASIAADVANARRRLQEDLEANQNRLLVELANASASLKAAPPPAWPDATAFGREVSARALGFAEHNAVTHEVGANALGMIVPVVVDIAVRAAAQTAASRASGVVLAEVGTLAIGAGDGAGAGSEFPVVGNVIGFGVGLFVSALAMHYEEARADQSLRENITGYIDTLKAKVIGDADAPSEILRGMSDYVDGVGDAERRIITQDVMAMNSEVAK